ncbi:PEP-CTERM sorting domain-containing protein [Akkermansiaceae bacterium]|nr:PEP-CTERM sorting domain-containing protein [Akkermansiaceae bacterium]
MKTYIIIMISLVSLISGLRGQTIEWGSEVFSQIVDSKGAALDNTYVFEIGVFADTFTPTDANTDDWFANWFAFDRAAYSETNGYFASTAEMTDAGTSESPFMTAAAPSFEGLEAYVWVRNSATPSPTTEWFLVKSPAWTFPDATPGCCDNALPVQWSLADLTPTNTPVWGSQMGTDGQGEFTSDGVYELQTYTFVPEPSSALLALLGCAFLLTRRSRPQ